MKTADGPALFTDDGTRFFDALLSQESTGSYCDPRMTSIEPFQTQTSSILDTRLIFRRLSLSVLLRLSFYTHTRTHARTHYPKYNHMFRIVHATQKCLTGLECCLIITGTRK